MVFLKREKNVERNIFSAKFFGFGSLVLSMIDILLMTPSSAFALTGLRFPANNTTRSDIRMNWLGTNLLPRTSQTAIWKIMYSQQSGYYTVAWQCSNDGTFHYDKYEFGTHPYPCRGSFDASGQSTQGTSNAGTVHYFEIAGLGEAPAVKFGHDYIASPGGKNKLVVKGVWYTQARTVEIINGTTLRHKFWTDVVNDPNHVIQQDIPLSSLNTVAKPVFLFGCSPWTSSNFNGTGSGYSNNECPSGVLRSIKLFNKPLTLADITAEAAGNSNSAVTSAGKASVWYINENPTPSDITDKSGAGHSPSWANANRPLLWSDGPRPAIRIFPSPHTLNLRTANCSGIEVYNAIGNRIKSQSRGAAGVYFVVLHLEKPVAAKRTIFSHP